MKSPTRCITFTILCLANGTLPGEVNHCPAEPDPVANFPPIQPVIDYLETSIKKQPFQAGLHRLIGFAPQEHQ